MKIIFLDFDGVLNSYQEVIMKHRRQKLSWYWRWREKFSSSLYWGSYTKNKQGHLRTSFSHDWKIFGWLREFSRNYVSDHCEFCPIACSNVQYILDENPDVRVVVSSVWRSDGVKRLRKIFERNGMDPSRIIGTTPHSKGFDKDGKEGSGRRGCQIQEWLTTHNHARKLANLEPVTDFVIIDDDGDMEHLMDRLVQTCPNEGFMWRHVNKAIDVLKGKGAARPWDNQD